MEIVKEVAIETIKRLPNECSIEDIMYEMDFIAQVLDGLKDANEGKLLTTKELFKKLALEDSYVKNSGSNL